MGGGVAWAWLTLLCPCRAVALELQANREPDFRSLVSPLSSRKRAAQVFYLLLGECWPWVYGQAGRPMWGPADHPLLPLAQCLQRRGSCVWNKRSHTGAS